MSQDKNLHGEFTLKYIEVEVPYEGKAIEYKKQDGSLGYKTFSSKYELKNDEKVVEKAKIFAKVRIYSKDDQRVLISQFSKKNEDGSKTPCHYGVFSVFDITKYIDKNFEERDYYVLKTPKEQTKDEKQKIRKVMNKEDRETGLKPIYPKITAVSLEANRYDKNRNLQKDLLNEKGFLISINHNVFYKTVDTPSGGKETKPTNFIGTRNSFGIYEILENTSSSGIVSGGIREKEGKFYFESIDRIPEEEKLIYFKETKKTEEEEKSTTRKMKP